MNKFYLFLWLRWVIRVSVCSVLLASLFSFIITTYIYFKQNMPAFTTEVTDALLQVWLFWFPVMLSFTFLLALFRSLKYIFNTAIAGYELQLLECKGTHIIEPIGYGDLVKVWRKWFMLIIWLVGIEMIFSIAYTNFFTSLSGILDWFNVYYLILFVFIAGYISFIILSARCKRTRIVKC